MLLAFTQFGIQFDDTLLKFQALRCQTAAFNALSQAEGWKVSAALARFSAEKRILASISNCPNTFDSE